MEINRYFKTIERRTELALLVTVIIVLGAIYVTASGFTGSSANDLVTEYRFEEGAGDTAYDTAGSNNGTINGVTWTDSKKGKVLSFDGNDDTVTASLLPEVSYTKDYTVSFWIKTADTNQGSTVFENSQSCSDRNGVTINNNEIQFGYYDGSSWTGKSGAINSNKWHHVVAVNDAGILNLYLDGEETTGTSNPYAACSGLQLGRDTGNNQPYFEGEIDRLRIYSKSLDQSQAKSLYNEGSYALGSEHQSESSKVLDMSFTEKNSSYVFDTSGSENHGFIQNGASQESAGGCKVGRCYNFDESGGGGNGQFIETNPASDLSKQEITAMAWIKPRSSTDSRAPIVRADEFYFQHYSNDRLATFWYGWNKTGYHTSSSNSVPTGKWSHVAVTWDNETGVQFYINGKKDNQVINTGPGNPLDWIKIGQENSGRRFNGRIDNVKLFNRSLSQQEIIQKTQGLESNGAVLNMRFDSGGGDKAFDMSSYENHGSLKPNETYGPSVTKGINGKALMFDGSDDKVEISDDKSLNFTSQTTWSAWIKVNASGNSGYNSARVLGKNPNSGYGLQLQTDDDEDFGILINKGGDWSWWSISNEKDYYNRWSHLVFVFDNEAGEAHFYQDGEKIDTRSTSTDFSNTEGPLIVGDWDASGGRPFGGKIDQVSLYPYAMSTSKVKQLYNQGSSRIGEDKSERSSNNELVLDQSFNRIPVGERDILKYSRFTSTDTSVDLNQDGWTPVPWDSQLEFDDTFLSHDAGNNPEKIIFEQGGTYRVHVMLSHETNNARTNPGIKFAINGERRGRMGLSGYARNSRGTHRSGHYLEEIVEVEAGEALTVETTQMANSGNVNIRPNESILSIEEVKDEETAQYTSTDNSTVIDPDGSWVTIPWNKKLDDGKAYSQNTNEEITFDKAGTYRVHTTLTYNSYSSARNNPGIKFAINGNRRNRFGLSGYVRRASGHYEASNHLTEYITVNEGDTLTVQTTNMGTTGDSTLRSEESVLSLEKVDGEDVAQFTSDDTTVSINPNSEGTWVDTPWNKRLGDGDGDDLYTRNGDEITFNEPGVYNVHSMLTYEVDNKSHNYGYRRNPAPRFAINGQRRDPLGLSGYIRAGSNHFEVSNYLTDIVEVEEGDTLKVQTTRMGYGGTDYSTWLRADESVLSLQKIDIPLHDQSGEGNHGTPRGGLKWEKGGNCKIGRCLEFDGSKDYVSVPDNDKLDIQDGDLTASAWVKIPSDYSPSNHRIILEKAVNKHFHTGDGPGWGFSIDASGNIYGGVTDSSGDNKWETARKTDIRDDEWHFVNLVIDNGNRIKLYLDGELESNTSFPSTNFNNSVPLGIGASADSNTRHVKASIDGVKVHDRSLSKGEIWSLYTQGRDLSGPTEMAGPVGWWRMGQGGENLSDAAEDNDGIFNANLLDNSGFESGSITGNMYRVLTNNAGYSEFSKTEDKGGKWSVRHVKTGEDDQWSAVSWDLNLDSGKSYDFGTWYKCVEKPNEGAGFSVQIYNGTSWDGVASASLEDPICDSKWRFTSGEMGPLPNNIQTTNRVRFKWGYSTDSGEMYVDDTYLREDSADWVEDNKRDRVINFDGSGDSIEAGAVNVPKGDSARTFCAWTYLNQDKRGAIIHQGPGGTTDGNFDLEANVYANGGETNYYGIHYWGGGVRFDKQVELNKWAHLCVSHNGGNLNNQNTDAYFNGKSIDLLDTASINTASREIAIGDEPGNSGNNVWFSGKIDDVRIYPYALNKNQVQQVMNGGGVSVGK